MRRQQLELGTPGDEVLGGVEHVDDVTTVGSDDADPDADTSMQVEAVSLSGSDCERTPKVSHQRTYDRPFLLQGMDVTQQQVELDPTDPHVSMMAGVGTEETARDI